ncbi:hypothetical protein SOASR014_25080 [Pectobacterium carotovorum subsp. carotovorum]|nr:hypothetical protein SOASR014_25080 [Pectobacterium carotovorum subsp. carotovorum]GLX44953.1 hypothetical protein Pcaca01_26210 [Pectobacterium carotovorum subsp. carotovorum]
MRKTEREIKYWLNIQLTINNSGIRQVERKGQNTDEFTDVGHLELWRVDIPYVKAGDITAEKSFRRFFRFR